MATQLKINASADVGGRFSGPDLGEYTGDSAALWTVVLFVALVIVILGIARSLR